MKLNRKILAASAAGVIGATGITAAAIAATSPSRSSYPPIVQRLATTFHLDPSKVQQVFDQQHEANQQQRQANLKSHLDQAVKDGKLTQVQEDKLLTELQTLRDKYKSDNMQDRRENHQALRTELEDWAKQNGIDLSQVMPPQRSGMMHRHMMGELEPQDN